MKRRHYCGWYYGTSHFIAKVLPFVIEGLKENAQFLTVYGSQELELLKMAVKSSGFNVRPDTFVPAPLTHFSELQQKYGAQGLRKGLLSCLEQARSNGFHNLRISGQVTHELALTGSSLEEFLQWEKMYHQACDGLPIASLCMYDASLSVDRGILALCHDEVPVDRVDDVVPK